jgi:hypothetical protein
MICVINWNYFTVFNRMPWIRAISFSLHYVNKKLIAIIYPKKGYNFVPNKELRHTCLKASSVS